jgi:hypothetical protein
VNNLHKSHRTGRTVMNGIAKGQTPKLNTGTRRQASDLCSNSQVSEAGPLTKPKT